MILYQKLYDIDKNGRKTMAKSFKPVFKFKKNQREEYVKNGIKTLAQQNLFILKKLLNKISDYNASKLEKQYRQSQQYKKNICHYPSIDFANSNWKNETIVESYKFNLNKRYKTDNNKLPKIGGVTIGTNNKSFLTTHGGPLDRRYYKEATRSSRMNITQKSNFKTSHYGKRKEKEASNIDEESNEGSSSGKNESGDEKSDSGEGSGDGSGDGSGEGSGDGSGDGSGSGNGDGSGSGSRDGNNSVSN